MDEREAFHSAIWNTPDDDLPRLVYADWLDERGEHDAAMFLRLLCAVRTCPPDVDRLRPLVADFRRAMVKLPAKWVEDVCPVPPAVVVGAWVDVDHEANCEALEMVRKERRSRRDTTEEIGIRSHRPPRERSAVDNLVAFVWDEYVPELSPAAACEINGVPALVDVWSGVVMAVATYPAPDWCMIWTRNPSELSYRWSVTHDGPVGPMGTLDDMEAKPDLLRRAVAEFDPANHPT